MIRHRLFSKGETIYALLSNFRHPNIVFPVKCIIYDVKFDALMPQYQVKIISFFDDIAFLKRYFFGLTFKGNFQDKQVKMSLKRQNYTTIEDLERHFSERWETYLMVVDSVFCVKTKSELFDLFNSLQDFFVEKTIKDLYDLTTRKMYFKTKGKYNYHTRLEFEASIKKFLGERAGSKPDYFDKLLFRPDGRQLDDIEDNY